MNTFDRADYILSKYGIPRGEEPASSVLARGLIDKNNVGVIIADNLPLTLLNLQKSTGAVTAVVPLTGATLAFNLLSQDQTIFASPAGTLAALTVDLPPDAQSRLGQICRLVSTQTTTSLTITGAGPSPTIIGTNPTAGVANTSYAFQKVGANTWLRL